SPKTKMRPLSAFFWPSMATNPASVRISVDFPEPDAPISATISPRFNEKVRLSSTGEPRWNDFEIPLASTTTSGATRQLPACHPALPTACDRLMNVGTGTAVFPPFCLELGLQKELA